MKKRTITDDEFINLTIEVMNKPPISGILKDFEGLVTFPLIFSAALCAELFGDPDTPDKEEDIPFQTIYSVSVDDFQYDIYHGGILGNKYMYCRLTLPQGKITYKRQFDTVEEAYKELCIDIIR